MRERHVQNGACEGGGKEVQSQFPKGATKCGSVEGLDATWVGRRPYPTT